MYLYETINYTKKYPANVFVASIVHSSYHWHMDYELIFVLKGTLLLTDKDNSVMMKEGDIYLLNSKSIHSLTGQDNENLCLFIQINSNMLKNPDKPDNIYYFHLNSQNKLLSPTCGYEKMRSTIAKLGYAWIAQNSFSIYRVYSHLYEIIADLFEYAVYDIYVAGKVKDNNTELLSEILEYIQNNFKDSDVLSNICIEKGIGEKTLYKLLKREIGLSPSQLLLQTRIDHAKYLLRCTQKSIDYIVDECGFHSNSTFFRVFKQQVMISPLQYRNQGAVPDEMPEIKNYLNYSHAEATNLLKMYIKKE